MIYKCEYLKTPIKEYLQAFYNPIGNINYEMLKGASFNLARCSNCGSIFQTQIPNEFLMKMLYDEWINPESHFERHRRIYNTAYYYSKTAEEIMTIIDYFNSMPNNLRLFDFGFGWGDWCRMAQAFGCHVSGCELSNIRIEYARKYGIDVVNYEDIEKNSFDFINAESMFEHLTDPLETLNYLTKSLKPKGLIKISVPDSRNIEKILETVHWNAPDEVMKSLNPVLPFQHINCFNRNSLLEMAKLSNLSMVKIPIKVQYSSYTFWKPIKPFAINLLKPIYRNFISKGTYLFFSKK